jgi:hypothetical protein
MNLRSIGVLLGLWTIACSSVKSEDVLTDGMWADLAVTSDGAATTASGILRVGDATSNTFVDLEGDDVLQVTDASGTVPLVEVSVGDLFSYTAALGITAEGDEFSFGLLRTVDDGAPDSFGTLPAPLAVASPLDTPEWHPEVEPLTVTWEPAGSNDAMRVTVSSDCALTGIFDVPGDPGTFTVEAGDIEVTAEKGTVCSTVVRVERRRAGDLDPGFGSGGTIFGIQFDEVEVMLVP